MKEPNVYMFLIDDPDFKVESQEHYNLLIQRLAEFTIELEADYPDKYVFVTFKL